jgi:hypothetical protein
MKKSPFYGFIPLRLFTSPSRFKPHQRKRSQRKERKTIIQNRSSLEPISPLICKELIQILRKFRIARRRRRITLLQSSKGITVLQRADAIPITLFSDELADDMAEIHAAGCRWCIGGARLESSGEVLTSKITQDASDGFQFILLSASLEPSSKSAVASLMAIGGSEKAA